MSHSSQQVTAPGRIFQMVAGENGCTCREWPSVLPLVLRYPIGLMVFLEVYVLRNYIALIFFQILEKHYTGWKSGNLQCTKGHGEVIVRKSISQHQCTSLSQGEPGGGIQRYRNTNNRLSCSSSIIRYREYGDRLSNIEGGEGGTVVNRY